MKLIKQQMRNIKYLIFGIIMFFTITCFALCERNIIAQQSTEQAIEQLDRSKFSITAQCIETPDSSQVGWEYLKSPLLAKLNNRGLYIFYNYRDYRVLFPITNKLRLYQEKDFAGNIIYNKSSTGTDKWTYKTVIVRQWYTKNNSNGYLELYFPHNATLITYKIQFNHLISNLMKITEQVIPNVSTFNKGDVLKIKSVEKLIKLNDNPSYDLSLSTLKTIANREAIVKRDFNNHNPFIEVSIQRLNPELDSLDLLRNTEVTTVTKEIKGVTNLPATEDIYNQLKPGDRVLLKKDCENICMNYPISDPVSWNIQMSDYEGMEVKIISFNKRRIYAENGSWPRKAIERITFISKL